MNQELFSGTGMAIPNIMLPNRSVDLEKWAVVACDQYTSEPEYWNQAEAIVGACPSTLRIILPEIYLDKKDAEQRIENINRTMVRYIDENILEDIGPAFVLVERTFPSGSVRKGLTVALDLECYDYSSRSESLIRPTEGTVEDRLPPRLKIRKDAPLESPHILVLIDDPDKTVIEPLFEEKDRLEKLYDTPLMLNGGHVRGYKVSSEEHFRKIADAINALGNARVQKEKYGQEGPTFLFAMGDGNHSLATAKAHWMSIKKNLTEKQAKDHPARFALVELVNLHDPGIVFEPIHRVLFGVAPEKFIKDTLEYMEKEHPGSFFAPEKPENSAEYHCIKIHGKDCSGYLCIKNPSYTLEYRTVQEYLDFYLANNPSVKIDYIHGENALKTLSNRPFNTGIEMEAIGKFTLFKTVMKEGPLPRKSFSMGEAYEKRYYMECRKIKP